MGRRVKASKEEYQETIANAAEKVFQNKGIEAANMDEIAKLANFSKATVYVYFNSKEDIVNYLALRSMKLFGQLVNKAASKTTLEEQFMGVCYGLSEYQEKFPFYFDTLIKRINFKERESDLPIFDLGEEINNKVIKLLNKGIEENVFKENTDNVETIFRIWGMIIGLIQMAVNKEDYLAKEKKTSKKEFLEVGFQMVYDSLRKR